MKKALLLCATHNDLGLILALKKLGYYVIATGGVENLHGQKLCDKFILADYSDKELILEIAKKEKIDAVIANCNDFGVISAAFVAEKLGLKGHDSFETTLKIHNKDKFKHFCLQNGISSPISQGFNDINKANSYIKSSNPTYPLIIKPIDLSAGKGVSVAKNAKEAQIAILKAFETSRLKRIVIEPFIKGTQHGYCTFLIKGKIVATCSNNEYSILNPYRVEIDTFPASNYKKISRQLNSQIEKIARCLKLKDGIFHCQYIYDGKKAWIIEAMRRILGNMYHIPGNLLTNMNWEYWEVCAKCGLSLKDFPKNVKQEGFFAYKTILADKDGVLEGIERIKEYDKFVLSAYTLQKRGFEIKNHTDTPLKFLFMQFASQKEMQEALIKNYKILAKTSPFLNSKSEAKKLAKPTNLQKSTNSDQNKQHPNNSLNSKSKAFKAFMISQNAILDSKENSQKKPLNKGLKNLAKNSQESKEMSSINSQKIKVNSSKSSKNSSKNSQETSAVFKIQNPQKNSLNLKKSKIKNSQVDLLNSKGLKSSAKNLKNSQRHTK
ncbi:ATP-grasp domain-containing protein [Campylobacter troglodytis]|uniref:ATP-grasp domain-containing protein n=1 Tax=Campylobacter troglodytis TaxID=654363 RepID=UPI001158ED36|nr:hypothetical protein [Campylobacter troglodytis]TQR54332.1 hypothetical protein DMC01_10310 [Campylobacter troglodytis]